MEVILVLIGAALFVELIFVGAFLWAVRSGQFDDTETPSARILHENTTGHEEKTNSGLSEI